MASFYQQVLKPLGSYTRVFTVSSCVNVRSQLRGESIFIESSSTHSSARSPHRAVYRKKAHTTVVHTCMYLLYLSSKKSFLILHTINIETLDSEIVE